MEWNQVFKGSGNRLKYIYFNADNDGELTNKYILLLADIKTQYEN